MDGDLCSECWELHKSGEKQVLTSVDHTFLSIPWERFATGDWGLEGSDRATWLHGLAEKHQRWSGTDQMPGLLSR